MAYTDRASKLAARRAPAHEDPFLSEVIQLTPKLRAYATGLTGCAERADDVVHDSLVRVLRFRHSFEPGTNLPAWLYSIVRNTYFTSIKRRGWMVSDPDGSISAELESPPDQEWKLRHKELLQAMRKLEPDARSLLMLVAGGSSYEEAAGVRLPGRHDQKPPQPRTAAPSPFTGTRVLAGDQLGAFAGVAGSTIISGPPVG